MINSNKIGKFICELRKGRNLSQEKLGNLLGIERVSISKWERGVTLPSHEMLLKLSTLFDVSVNEILYGEKLSKQNEEKINEVSANLYNVTNKRKKIIIVLITTILIITSLFGIYYFFNSYKSIKIYTITGDGKYAYIDNGIYIFTKGKIYFSINQINTSNNEKIKQITLYYKKINNLIISTDNTNLIISQKYGENEYFKTNYFKDIEDNIYLLIEYESGKTEIIKLYFTQDYINNNLIFNKANEIIMQENKKEKNIPSDLTPIINNIQKIYKTENNIYKYEKEIQGEYISSYYIPKTGEISLIITKDKKIIEDWTFYIFGKSLVYNAYDGNNILYSFTYENDSVSCTIQKCDKADEKIQYFWNYLYELM